MSLLESLTIENFRGFDRIVLSNFSKINIILGRNNSGKTSVLEAIFLLVGMSNPASPDRINGLRGVGLIDAKSDKFKYLFHNLITENKPEFEAKFGDLSERTLCINPLFQDDSDKDKLSSESILSSVLIPSQLIEGLELNFSIKEKDEAKRNYKASVFHSSNKITQNLANQYKESINAFFISSESTDSDILSEYSEIVKRKKEEVVLRTLQAFDEKVESIQALPDGIYIGLKDVDELVLINFVGDGLKRYLQIISAVANPDHSIILIDEIENGLHYSVYKLLWKSILSMISTLDTQLFITTHNVEILECLNDVLEEEDNKTQQNLVKAYTIAKTKNAGFKAYEYTYEGIRDAIQNELEMRG